MFNLGAAATDAIRAAQTGQSQRGEQDYMLRFEARFPGFGGYYVDSIGDLVLVLTNPERYSAPVLRAELDAEYASRDVASVRDVWRSLGPTRVQKGNFSLSELVAIQTAIGRSTSPIPGRVAVGTQIHTNAVLVDFSSESSLPRGVAAIRAQGIPDAALIAQVTGPVQLAGVWTDKIRPTAGGPIVTLQDPSVRGDSILGGSHGFNAHTRPPYVNADFFMLSAHQVNTWNSTNGNTGQKVFQGFRPDTMGTVVVNPAWDTTGCGTDSTGTPAFYCTTADVALGARVNFTTFSYGVGTSTTEGLNGAVGSNTINGVYALAGVITPSQVPVTRNLVHKSGYRTGTTTGAVVSTCTDLWSSVPFAGGNRSIQVKCTAVLDHIGWGFGDSGSPVFARLVSGGPYYALGILVAGGGTFANGICNAGVNCRVFFNTWAAIEARVGYLLSP
jgi:hypothetical protein